VCEQFFRGWNIINKNSDKDNGRRPRKFCAIILK
jgi:hypothetical protein